MTVRCSTTVGAGWTTATVLELYPVQAGPVTVVAWGDVSAQAVKCWGG
jgi:hypothetical protein